MAADENAAQLIFHTRAPNNAEPPLDALAANWLTPTDLFYIRSHAPNPAIDRASFRLTIDGLVKQSLELSLEELAEMSDTEAIATLTCAGNRRSEHSAIRKVDGVPWQEGAIGNARWGGVKLSTLLRKAGVQEDAAHVWFEGLDEIEKGGQTIPFGGSIPIEKCFLDSEQMPGAIVALTMNGQPLTPDHGAPVRTVVPGYIGARSVKWLGKITVSNRPSPNHYVRNAYKITPFTNDLLLAETAPIYAFPLNAAICSPTAGAEVPAGMLTVRGYALANGSPPTAVGRVEVSANGGTSWRLAKLAGPSRPYCWNLWQARIPVDATTRKLFVRTVDTAGQASPVRVAWNPKGYLFNAWHSIPLRVKE